MIWKKKNAFSMTRFLLSTDKRFSWNFGRLMGHLFPNCQLFSLLACCLRFFDMLFVNDRHVTYLSLFSNHANHEQFSMEIWKQFSTALVILQCALWLIQRTRAMVFMQTLKLKPIAISFNPLSTFEVVDYLWCQRFICLADVISLVLVIQNSIEQLSNYEV